MEKLFNKHGATTNNESRKMIVYKYCTFEVAVKSLLGNSLLASHFDEYNDPFDAQIYNKSLDQERDDEINADLALSRDGEFNSFKDGIRSTCFSRSNRDIMMWSHYADYHRGVVLAFSSGKLVDTRLNPIFGDVKYNGDMIRIFKSTSENIFMKKMQEALFTKSKIWSYEEEVRLLVDNNNSILTAFNDTGTKKLMPFIPKSLVSIYFGCRTTAGDGTQSIQRALMREYIKLRSEKEKLTNVRVKRINQYECTTATKFYELEIAPITSVNNELPSAKVIRKFLSKFGNKYLIDLQNEINQLKNG